MATNWPATNDPDEWPHTVFLTISSNTNVPSVVPTFTDKVLTWELVIKNTTSGDLNLSWPNIYKGFNSETLPNKVPGNSTIFMMLRKYTDNYVLVSKQGTQSNSSY